MNAIRHFFSNWKTSLGGIALAALQVIENGRTPKQIALAIFTAVLGAVAKDPGK